ncbi:MAG TPA: DUF2231 domain-containing protein [Actinophytocola sp.]|nr:DUF2231 domain-containing protein [Actinophytocola sp.]
MLPEFINGLPLHALVVHFVVVLLPIAVAGSILTAVWPAVRRRYGWLAVAAAGVGALLVPVATTSGTELSTRIPPNPLIAEHERLGDMMIWWAVPLFIVVAALMVLHRMGERQGVESAAGGPGTTATKRTTGTTVAMLVAAVLTVGIAVGTGVHIFRVGEAGSRAVWEFVEDTPPNNTGG